MKFCHIFRHIKNKLLQIIRSSFIVSVSCSINFQIIIIYSINFIYFCASFVCSIHRDPVLKVCKSWFKAPRKHIVYLMLFQRLRRRPRIKPTSHVWWVNLINGQVARKSRNIDLVLCCIVALVVIMPVCNAGSTLNKHWFNASYLLGVHWPCSLNGTLSDRERWTVF